MSSSDEIAAATVNHTTSSSDSEPRLELQPGQKLHLIFAAPYSKLTKDEFDGSSSSILPFSSPPSLSSSDSNRSFQPPSPSPRPFGPLVIQIGLADQAPSPNPSVSPSRQKCLDRKREIQKISEILLASVGISMTVGLMFSNSPVVKEIGTLVASPALYLTFFLLMFGIFLRKISIKYSFLLQLLGIGSAILALSASGFSFLSPKLLKWFPVVTGIIGVVGLVIYVKPVLDLIISGQERDIEEGD